MQRDGLKAAPDSQRSTEKIMDIEKTRNGILSCLQKKGGTLAMSALHGYSKLIHQVAHQEFSEVMEGLVSDELVVFEDDNFILTEKGLYFITSL